MGRENIPGRDAIVRIYDEWLRTPPRHGAVVVEVGVALGKSISYVADRLIAMGRTDVRLYAVDTWEGIARNGEQQTMADSAGGDFTLYARMMLENDPRAFELVRPIRMDSVDAAECFGDGEVDLVVLDSDHTYERVRDELHAWARALGTAGWISGDDHHEAEYPGVGRACRERYGTDYEIFTDNEWAWPVWLRRGRA